MNVTASEAGGAAMEALQSTADVLSGMDASQRMDFFFNALKAFLPKALTAVVLAVVGMLLVRGVLKLTRRLLARSKLDATLHGFVLSVLRVVLDVFLGVVVLTVLVPSAVGSMVALLGVFGLAISLAVKDSLANLAGGISVLFTKPFSLGDYVLVGSVEGTVQEIRLNYTVLKTVDNKAVHIPNGDVAKAQIVNYTYEPTRRLDLKFSIGYHDSFEQAQKIILSCLAQHPMALADPAPLVRMWEHGESAIVIVCRVWCATGDYWPLHFDLLEQVKQQFDAAGISIPFQQMDVHLHQ